MCRTLSEGGRRCRHHDDAHQVNAARRAAYAARRAGAASGVGGSPVPGGAGEPAGPFGRPSADVAPAVAWPVAVEHVQATAERLQVMRDPAVWLDEDRGGTPRRAGRRAEAQLRTAGALISTEVDQRVAAELADITAAETQLLGGGTRRQVLERTRQQLEQGMAQLRELEVYSIVGHDTMTRSELADQAERLIDFLQPMAQLVTDFEQARDPFAQRRMEARAKVTAQLLADVRPMGTIDAGSLYLPISDPEPRPAVELAAQLFPAQWLQRSRQGRPLVLMAVQERGCYSDHAFVRVPATGERLPVSLLQVDPRGASRQVPGFPTATHELAHRMEAASGAPLRQAQAVFMWRRTTDPATGERQPLEPYLQMPDELTRPDGFVDTYVGKHYPDHFGWEALSVGIEAVFAARYGNLTGEGAWAPDEDHRRFTLGALATL